MADIIDEVYILDIKVTRVTHLPEKKDRYDKIEQYAVDKQEVIVQSIVSVGLSNKIGDTAKALIELAVENN